MSQETVITPPSPELLSPHQRSEALKTRLAIGKDALEVDNKTVIKVVSVKELRDSFEKTRENTESRIAKASVGKRMEYWQKQGVKEKPEQMKKWKQDVAGLCHSQENQDKIDTLSSRHIGAVDWKNITDEQIGQLHEKYFGSSVSQKVTLQRSDGTALQIPAGTSDFINEVIMSYTNTDGTIDYASLQKDRASLEFMAGIFGIDKLLFEYIDVVTTLKDEQRTHALIALANQDIPSPLDVTKQTTRINSLNSYEEEQLRLLSEGYEIVPAEKPELKIGPNTLISQIEPIQVSRNLTIINSERLSEVVEYPLLKPCQDLWHKGIRTLSTSANRNNVHNRSHIIIEWDSLSPENKAIAMANDTRVLKLDGNGAPLDKTKIRVVEVNPQPRYDGRGIVTIEIPISETTTAGQIERGTSEITDKFVKQPAIWVEEFILEDLKQWNSMKEASLQDFIDMVKIQIKKYEGIKT